MDRPDNDPILLGRRGVLRLGGLSVATLAVIAACSKTEAGTNGRVGEAPTTTALPDPIVSDIAVLRTSSSLEYSLIEVYDTIIGNTKLLPAEFNDIATRFRDDHKAFAKTFEELTKKAGGTAWTCGNPKVDSALIAPVLHRITESSPKTATTSAIGPSDDMPRDIKNFIAALESLAAATYQSFVSLFATPAYRAAAMTIGAAAARHAALLALRITPGAYVSSLDAQNALPDVTTTIAPTTTVQDIATPTTLGKGEKPPPTKTEIPYPVAIPSQFGALGSIQIVVGDGDENGTRLKLNLDSPSLNSMIFEYFTQASCPGLG